MKTDCIFCKIIAGEIPAKLEHETEDLIVFPDIDPSAEVHFLIVPKKHVDNIFDTTDQPELLTKIYRAAEQLVMENKLEPIGYRISVNGGAYQHVKHLHFHLLSGKWLKHI